MLYFDANYVYVLYDSHGILKVVEYYDEKDYCAECHEQILESAFYRDCELEGYCERHQSKVEEWEIKTVC